MKDPPSKKKLYSFLEASVALTKAVLICWQLGVVTPVSVNLVLYQAQVLLMMQRWSGVIGRR